MLTTMEEDVLELCTRTVTKTPITSPATGLDSTTLSWKMSPAAFPTENMQWQWDCTPNIKSYQRNHFDNIVEFGKRPKVGIIKFLIKYWQSTMTIKTENGRYLQQVEKLNWEHPESKQTCREIPVINRTSQSLSKPSSLSLWYPNLWGVQEWHNQEDVHQQQQQQQQQQCSNIINNIFRNSPDHFMPVSWRAGRSQGSSPDSCCTSSTSAAVE